MFDMNLAKVSANGQITVPVEIRRTLGLRSGDKVLFLENQDGEIVLCNASAASVGESVTSDENADESGEAK